jgi:hypothetical protein
MCHTSERSVSWTRWGGGLVQVSSLNLLKIIAEKEGCTVEELNAGRVADWFTKDAALRESDPDKAVLKW